MMLVLNGIAVLLRDRMQMKHGRNA